MKRADTALVAAAKGDFIIRPVLKNGRIIIKLFYSITNQLIVLQGRMSSSVIASLTNSSHCSKRISCLKKVHSNTVKMLNVQLQSIELLYFRAYKITRPKVERGIGQLKRRFGILHGEIRMKPEKACR